MDEVFAVKLTNALLSRIVCVGTETSMVPVALSLLNLTVYSLSPSNTYGVNGSDMLANPFLTTVVPIKEFVEKLLDDTVAICLFY
jgi:hypothetical protein